MEASECFRRSLALSYRPAAIDNFNLVRDHLAQHLHVEIPFINRDPLHLYYPSEFCDPEEPGLDSSDPSSCNWDPINVSVRQMTHKIEATCQATNLRISRKERQSGNMELDTLLHARSLVRTCGVVVFERLFSKVRQRSYK